MQPCAVLSVSFEDESLLDGTISDYIAAVERGEMTEEEARSDADALALGMLQINID